MNSAPLTNYIPGNPSQWNGRVDGFTPDLFRWHQVVSTIDLREDQSLDGAFVLLGFCCDEGVRRNQGRIGAKRGPETLRKVLAGLPVHFDSSIRLVDAGDVICEGGFLEESQRSLTIAVNRIIKSGGFPILMGGGHEITFPHFLGIQQASDRSVGIINLDAHLDIRPLVDGKGNSGTGFYQIAEYCERNGIDFKYLAVGIQEISNTKALFNFAQSKSVQIYHAKELHEQRIGKIIDEIIAFGRSVESVYLTVDLDVFSAAYAPGVSAPAFQGIVPDINFDSLFSTILELPNLRSVDVAELNPTFDLDNRTAKLAAHLLFKVLQK